MEQTLNDYVDKFGENFPVMLFRTSSEADIVRMIADCIRKGVPFVPELDAACDY